ncbi:hypothetical protein JW948_13965 [bacterium]|nr:hypothetical protein [bacterium]
MIAGLIGGIVGGVIGVTGGIIGTWCSIKNTQGPRERAFMIRASVAFWIFGVVFITLLLTLPAPYKWFLWLPWGMLLPLGIHRTNKKLREIRQEESKHYDGSPS